MLLGDALRKVRGSQPRLPSKAPSRLLAPYFVPFILQDYKIISVSQFMPSGQGVGAVWAETEIPRERASIAHRKVFARPESFCA